MLEPARTLPRVPDAPWLQSLPPMSRFILRGKPAIIGPVAQAFGVAPSEQACRASIAGDRAALWLGPDEWLLLAPPTQGVAIASDLAGALAPHAYALVDVSHRQIALDVSGPRAAEILNAGCPLDLDEEAFPIGMCTRTVFGKAEVLLWRKGSDRFHMEVWRSFAAYVCGVLQQAA